MLKYLVVDANLIIQAVFFNPLQAKILQRIVQWKNHNYQLCAPTLYLYEAVSTLNKAVRFSQITLPEAESALSLIHQIDIQLVPPDEQLAKSAFDWTHRLKRAAAYDSFYLALAESYQCEFWTTDKKLFNAAQQSWVHLFKAENA